MIKYQTRSVMDLNLLKEFQLLFKHISVFTKHQFKVKSKPVMKHHFSIKYTFVATERLLHSELLLYFRQLSVSISTNVLSLYMSQTQC